MNEKVTEFKKELILETAHKYFAKGYKGAQVDKIAKELGIGVGTIYSMFDSKEGLFLSWLFSVMEKAYQELKEQFEVEKNPLLQCESFVSFKLGYYEKNKAILRDYIQNNQLFLKNTTRRKENPMKKIYLLVSKAIEALFEKEGLSKSSPTTDFYLLAYVLDGLVNGYIEKFIEEGEEIDFNTKTKEVMKMFLNSIGAKDVAYDA